MSDQWLGEIRMFSFNYAPVGWVLCNGQLLQISQYQALYSLIGTTYGGDGKSTFAVPNMVGRVPVGQGTGTGLPPISIAQMGGELTHTLTASELPVHTHTVLASNLPADQLSPQNNVWASSPATVYSATKNTTMDPSVVTSEGGNLPHDNVQPYICINYCMSTTGLYPSPS